MIRLEVLNDTIMIKIGQDQQIILSIFIEKGQMSSSEVHDDLVERGNDVSLITVKRTLSEMRDANLLEIFGAGRSVKYTISSVGRLFTNIDSTKYNSIEPDKRYGLKSFNFSIFEVLLNDVFTESENSILENATSFYQKQISDLSKTIQEKELERFIIELSWKSSKIEGNTYELLETQRLIERGIEAQGHDKKEAIMILNHKYAFNFIRENMESFKTISQANIEEVHKILVKDMDVGYGLRSKLVGITGSLYRPLDNQHQILEAVQSLVQTINKIQNPYAKALLAVVGISYIQPFEDGNKRTSRLVANAILLAHGLAPLSYRSVDENTYREAILVFYELNSILAFKKIFIEQYDFAARNYAVK